MTIQGKQCTCGRRIEVAVSASIPNVDRAIRLAMCDDCRSKRGEAQLRGVTVRLRVLESWFSLPKRRE